jgi:hypothetical protein
VRFMSDSSLDILEWSVHPFRQQPGRSALVILTLVALSVLVMMSIDDPQLGVLAGGAAMLFLLVTLNRFFLPSLYRIDANGIAVRYPIGSKSLRWKDLRRFPHDTAGGYLSTRSQKSAFDRRGISVLFGGRGEEIIPRIESAMELNQ